MNNKGNRQENRFGPISFAGLSAAERLSWADKVEGYRLAAGMTQAELSDAAGVSLRTIGNMEAGQRAPQADNLTKVFRALDQAQATDVREHYSDNTRQFISTTAPLFDSLPADRQPEAAGEVVRILLSIKTRPSNVTPIRPVSGGLQNGPAPFDVDAEERKVAYEQTQPEVGDPQEP